MNLRLLLCAAAGALALVACSRQDEVAQSKAVGADAAPAEAAMPQGAPAPAGYAIRPGYWENVSDSGDGEPEVTLDCVTPEDARIEAMSTRLGSGVQEDGCVYSKTQFGDGRIDIAASCDHGGISGTTSMKGSYSGDRVDYLLDITMNAGAEPVSLKTRVKGRRIADACPVENS